MKNFKLVSCEIFHTLEILPALEKFHTLEIFTLCFFKNIKITQPPMEKFLEFEIIPCERNIPNA